MDFCGKILGKVGTGFVMLDADKKAETLPGKWPQNLKIDTVVVGRGDEEKLEMCLLNVFSDSMLSFPYICACSWTS